jgi:hypothetical protein
MMGLLTFGMVTILLLTLVTFEANPAKIWSSNTIAPESTWEGIGNQLSQSNWKPANHIATFLGKEGAMLLKLQQQNNQINFTQIDSSLNGRVLNPTTIPNTFLLLENNGNLWQTTNGLRTTVYRSRNFFMSAPIQWGNHCLTGTSASNLTTFDRSLVRFGPDFEYQQWMHRENGQVVNMRSNSCLDVGTGNSTRMNTCDSTKSTQKWMWVNGYLQVTISKVTSCLKAIPRTIDLKAIPLTIDLKAVPLKRNPNSFNSVIGLCDGPRMAWNI